MIRNVSKKYILSTNEKHIAFAINSEGINNAGLPGIIAYNYWPELMSCGLHEIGTVLTKKVGDITFHALVTYSLDKDWEENQDIIIKECFDKIPCNGKTIASPIIGDEDFDFLLGANVGKILLGMQNSSQNISLYGQMTLEEINEAISKETSKSKRLLNKK